MLPKASCGLVVLALFLVGAEPRRAPIVKDGAVTCNGFLRIDYGQKTLYLRGLWEGWNYGEALLRTMGETGIAPPLRFVDPERGVAVMDFVTQRPLQEYPGGSPALVRDLGALIRRLQESAAFPIPAPRHGLCRTD